MRKLLLILWIIFGCVSLTHAEIENFQEAKKAAKLIWQDHKLTFYCGCQYDNQLVIDHASCHYRPLDARRAKRVEWEHVVPVSWFGYTRPCWRERICKTKKGKTYAGRQCCEKVDPEFRRMYYDLHNLVPAVGEINQARAHFRFIEGQINQPSAQGCEIQIDENRRTVIPKPALKGMIARIYLYMAHQYPLKLSKQQREQFIRWHRDYPPDAWEKEWNLRVKAVQGTDNHFISNYFN